MPSQEHEAIVDSFRARPALVLPLLHALGIQLEGDVVARALDSAFGTLAVDYQADAVIELVDPRGSRELVVVVEVQLTVQADKTSSWPVYEANARARYAAPACVLVVAPSAPVERWARRTIAMGPSGSTFVPLVLGAGAVPTITDQEEARALPELAVLSAMAHGNEGKTGLDVVLAALAGVAGLTDERATLCYDLILDALSSAARRAVEELMQTRKYEYKSDFARKYFGEGVEKGKAEGMAAGKAEGMAAGKAEGMAAGKAEGMAAGKAEALLMVLRARGLAPSEADESRILATGDAVTLERWIARAATAKAIEDVFGLE